MSDSADSEPSQPPPPPYSSSYPQQPPSRLPLPAAMLQASFHAGPLPPPQQISAYEMAYPGAAKWIFEQSEANSSHVRQMELQAIRYQARDDLLHRVLPFSLVAVLIFASVIMAVFASKVLGGIAFFGTLASVVTVYLRGSQVPAGQSSEATTPMPAGQLTPAPPPG